MTDSRGLWTNAQVWVSGALAGSGLVVLVVSYVGAAAQDDLRQQVGWLNAGVVGLLVTGAASGWLLLCGRRSIGTRRRHLILDAEWAPNSDTAPNEAGWVHVDGSDLAHRSWCPLVQNKTWRVLTVEAIRSRALRRCRVCSP